MMTILKMISKNRLKCDRRSFLASIIILQDIFTDVINIVSSKLPQ